MSIRDDVRNCIERWNGGHWEIDAAEVQALADAICELPEIRLAEYMAKHSNLPSVHEHIQDLRAQLAAMRECLEALLPYIVCDMGHEEGTCPLIELERKARAILEETAKRRECER